MGLLWADPYQITSRESLFTWEQKEKGLAVSSHRNKALQALMSIFLGGTSG
jgi:hypothetical protein